MPLFSDRDLEEVRHRTDIVQVIGERIPLKRAGHNFKGLCPFHQEKSPSFMVHPEKQIFHCFGCGEGGDVFSFLMKHEGLGFSEAVEMLAERYGVSLQKQTDDDGKSKRAREEKELYLRINRLVARFFYEMLQSSLGKRGLDYLKNRSIRPEIFRDAYLGYAPSDGKRLIAKFQEKKVPLPLAEKLGLIRRGTSGDYYDFFRDRLIFSVVSPDGKFLGFSGRALEDSVQPKYLNSPESPIYHKSDSLLGMHMARASIREKDQVILVEGNFDLIRLHQEGIRNVVAPLGTSLTERQVRYLRRLTENFVLIFDGDAAGMKAASRSLEIFLPMGLSPRVVLLPQGEDPDSFVKKNGPERLTKMISEAPALLDVRIEHILSEEGSEAQGQVRGIRRISEILEKLPGDVEKSVYYRMVGDRYGLPSETLLATVQQKSTSARKFSNFFAKDVEANNRGADKLPPIERMVLEVLLSGHVNPAILLEEIQPSDFVSSTLGTLWEIVRSTFRREGQLELSRLLLQVEEEKLKKLLTELSFAGSRWTGEGEKLAEDCVKQLRVHRLRGRLKNLSVEIRKAERGHELDRVKELMDEKNRLIKEMNSFH